jgi:hypothetical protein
MRWLLRWKCLQDIISYKCIYMLSTYHVFILEKLLLTHIFAYVFLFGCAVSVFKPVNLHGRYPQQGRRWASS